MDQRHHTPPADPRELRGWIDARLDAGEHAAAAGGLSALWRAASDAGTASFVVSRYERARVGLSLTPMRLAVLRSFTVEPIVPMLRASAFTIGLDLTVRVGEFGTYAQDIVNPGSDLYAPGEEPGAAILAVQARDVAPDLWARFAEMAPEDVESAVRSATASFRGWIDGFRARSRAHLIVHLLATPATPALGVLDAQQEVGQVEAIRRINAGICAAARGHRNVYVLDIDRVAMRRGMDRLADERKWLTARLPYASGEMLHLAKEWLRFLAPISGRTCKALVCDLDNTLWGGVIGEDGMAGIRLDQEHPGAAHQRLQRAILDLFERGIILAVNSKNNEADAMEALTSHPGMLIRPDQFACFRINWQDKAQNLREIARELNIGVDALAFIDDNPVERQRIRQELPEVFVVELPEDPMGYADALRDAPVFERLALSAEDKVRGKMYAEQRLRSELMQEAGSLEDFYRSLEMRVEIGPVTPMTLARVAQLTQKTNQFNLTTRRYSESEIGEAASSPNGRVFSIRVEDRFGDNGIVGVAVLRIAGAACDVEALLLSCRVIGRTIETAFLAFLAEEARKAGCERLSGWFLPTKKNAPVKDFYAQHRFVKAEETASGTRWEYNLSSGGVDGARVVWPEWITGLGSAGAIAGGAQGAMR